MFAYIPNIRYFCTRMTYILFQTTDLKEIRKAKGIKQCDLAKQLGMKRADLGRIENGQANPRWSKVQDLAVALGGKICIMVNS